MVGPDWALLVLVVYPLVQIPLVLYLARWFELDGDAPIATPTRAYWTGQDVDERYTAGQDTAPGRCRHCGTENDPTYTYCENCVSPLS